MLPSNKIFFNKTYTIKAAHNSLITTNIFISRFIYTNQIPGITSSKEVYCNINLDKVMLVYYNISGRMRKQWTAYANKIHNVIDKLYNGNRVLLMNYLFGLQLQLKVQSDTINCENLGLCDQRVWDGVPLRSVMTSLRQLVRPFTFPW